MLQNQKHATIACLFCSLIHLISKIRNVVLLVASGDELVILCVLTQPMPLREISFMVFVKMRQINALFMLRFIQGKPVL